MVLFSPFSSALLSVLVCGVSVLLALLLNRELF
jgi:hypothetical protein